MRFPGWGAIQGVGAHPRRAGARLFAFGVLFAVLGPIAAPAGAQESAVVSQLEPVFDQARAATSPLEPLSVQLGTAIAEASAQMEAEATSAGSTLNTQAGQVIILVAAVVALAQAEGSLVTTTVGGVATELTPVAAQVADLLRGGSDSIADVIRQLEPQFRTAGEAAAPGIGMACPAGDTARTVFSLSPYGLAFMGVLAAFEPACDGDAAAATTPVDLTALEPALAELGALNAELFETTKPYADVLRPFAEPVCTVASPLVIGGTLAAGLVPAPVPIGAALAPAALACSFGSGPDPARAIIILTGGALGPVASFGGSIAGMFGLAAPILAPLSPLTGPLAKPYCDAGPLLDIASSILVPLEFPLEPKVMVTPLNRTVCSSTTTSPFSGDAAGDATLVPPGADAISSGGIRPPSALSERAPSLEASAAAGSVRNLAGPVVDGAAARARTDAMYGGLAALLLALFATLRGRVRIRGRG